MMQPLRFQPLIKSIRWGGTRLGTVLNKPIGDATDCAESWEIADHASGQSTVVGGELDGHTLNQLMQNHGAELLGRHHAMTQFPLLIKFLDANDWLSLQVHPNDAQAVTYDPHENGKTEAWIIIDAEPDSQICCGLKAGVTAEQLRQHLETGNVEDLLNLISVKAGDCVFVPAGTVHAIGSGILLAEVQQQSNLTFRLHDWGRVGTDGKPREIHVDPALACIDFDRGPVFPVTPVPHQEATHIAENLVECDHFVIRRHRSEESFSLLFDDRFRILMLLIGVVRISMNGITTTLLKGETILIPACVDAVEITPEEDATLLEVCCRD